MLASIPASSSASACRSAPSSRSVTPDIAETTASTGRCVFCSVQIGRRHADSFGGAHAGAAEFHHKQIVH